VDVVLEEVLDGGAAGLAHVQEPQHAALELRRGAFGLLEVELRGALRLTVAHELRGTTGTSRRSQDRRVRVPPRLRGHAKDSDGGKKHFRQLLALHRNLIDKGM